MKDAGNLYAEIAAVCPLTNCQIGNLLDRSTWTFTPALGATPQQIAAARQVIASFDVNGLVPGMREHGLAKNLLTDTLSPQQVLVRNVLRALCVRDTEISNKINEVITWANSLPPGLRASLVPLSGQTWTQTLDAIRQQIDAETDPNT